MVFSVIDSPEKVFPVIYSPEIKLSVIDFSEMVFSVIDSPEIGILINRLS